MTDERADELGITEDFDIYLTNPDSLPFGEGRRLFMTLKCIAMIGWGQWHDI
jgi:hypothetical protein